MDYTAPFNYIFKDKNYLKKIGIFIFFNLLVVTSPICSGYILEVIRRVREGSSEMPDFDGRYGDYFMDGLRFMVGLFILMIPILIVFVLGVIASAGALGSDSNAAAAAGVGAFIMFGLLCLFVLLCLCIAGMALSIVYSEDDGWSAFTNLGRIMEIIKADTGSYFIAVVVCFCYSAVASIVGNFIPLAGPVILMPLAQICAGHITGQYARNI